MDSKVREVLLSFKMEITSNLDQDNINNLGNINSLANLVNINNQIRWAANQAKTINLNLVMEEEVNSMANSRTHMVVNNNNTTLINSNNNMVDNKVMVDNKAMEVNKDMVGNKVMVDNRDTVMELSRDNLVNLEGNNKDLAVDQIHKQIMGTAHSHKGMDQLSKRTQFQKLPYESCLWALSKVPLKKNFTNTLRNLDRSKIMSFSEIL